MKDLGELVEGSVTGAGSIMLASNKQEAFAREYIKDLKPKQAAVRAGYAPTGASAQAYKLLRNDLVLDRIEYLLGERKRTLGLDSFWVVQNFMEIYNRCMQKEPVMVFDPEEKCMVQKTQVIEVDGQTQVEGVWEFDATNANRAMENIGKYLGMFIQKVDIKSQHQEIKWNVDVSPFMQKPSQAVVEEHKENKRLNQVKKKVQMLRKESSKPQKSGRKPV